MTTTEIRDALRAVQHAVDVPAPDQVAFQAEVRAARRRRTTGRALVGAAAVGALVVGGLGVRAIVADPDEPRLADTPGGEWDWTQTLMFVEHDGRLAALGGDGSLHDLGPRVDQLLGAPGSWMYVIDDGELDVRWAVPPYDDLESPVEGPVRSAALSRDGDFLAWLDPDGRVHRYDVQAEREDLAFEVGPGSEVVDVSSAGVLVADDGTLTVHGGNGNVDVPVSNDRFTLDAQLAGDQLLLNDSDGEAVLYDVSGGVARVVDTLRGPGELSPFFERVALVRPHGVDVWASGRLSSATGLANVTPTAVRWALETRLVVAGYDASDATVLYSCDVDLACTQLPVDGPVSFAG